MEGLKGRRIGEGSFHIQTNDTTQIDELGDEAVTEDVVLDLFLEREIQESTTDEDGDSIDRLVHFINPIVRGTNRVT